jgi:hypothetical protein
VANGMFQAWWPLEGKEKTFSFGGQWKNILVWWLMKKKKNHFHLLPLFTPKDFT